MVSSPHSCQRCGQKLDGPARFCPFCGAAQSGTGENVTPTARGPGSAWGAILEKLQLATTPKYNVIRILGYGGMAGVYLAVETRLERKVAIKVMSPGLMIDPQLVERFQQEARTMAQLNHRNIVSIFEIDQKDDLHYFAMTYVAGRTLSQVMADAVEPLPLPVITTWLWQVGNALAYAHQRGIVHRDIKPENILLDADGSALVTDFGIAKVADSPGLTRTGIIVGTPAYMSPEQCSGLSLTGASDQYALGAVAYQMLVGQPPFVGPTLSVLQAHVNERPASLRELRPDCPRDLADAVHRMLEKRADERFPDMGAALTALGAKPLGVNDPLLPTLTLLARHAATVQLDAIPGALAEGERHQLRAVALGPDDQVLEDRRIRWSSSDTGVAAVDEDGVLRAIQAGTAEISARSTEISTAAIVTVVPGLVDQVEVLPPESDVSTGEWVQLRPIVRQEGRESEVAAVAWSTTDPAIARVTAEGAVEGVNPGSATITATVGGKTGRTIVRVRAAQPAAAAPRVAPTRPAPARRVATRQTTAAPARPAAGPRRIKLVAAAAVLVVAVGALAMLSTPWRAGPDSLPQEDPEILPPPTAAVDLGDRAVPEAESTGAAPAALAGLGVSGPVATSAVQDPLPAAGGQERPAPPEAAPPVVAEPAEAVVADGRLLIGSALPSGAELTAVGPDGRTHRINGAIAPLPPGSYLIRFRAPGYEAEEARVRIRSNESSRWAPALNAIVTAPEPTPVEPQPVPVPDPAADRAAAEAAVRGVVEATIAALHRRDVNAALPAFQANAREGWRQLLTAREVQDWSARMTDYALVSMSDGSAEVGFTLRFSFLQSGTRVNQAPPYKGILQRAGSEWRLLYIEPR